MFCFPLTRQMLSAERDNISEIYQQDRNEKYRVHTFQFQK
jgi:hypothetical protein